MADHDARERQQILIDQLARELKPVRPFRPRVFSALILLGMSLLFIAGVVWIAHPRSDLIDKVLDFDFLLSVTGSFAIAICTFLICTTLRQPGLHVGKLGKITLLMGAVLAFLIFKNISVQAILQPSPSLFPSLAPTGLATDLSCAAMVLVTSLLLASVILLWSRSAAPEKPWLLGLTIGCACLVISSLAIAFHCPSDNAVHVAFSHFLVPGILGVAICTGIGHRFLRW